MVLWDKEKRASAQELIDWLLSRRAVIGGWPIEWITTVAFAELGSSSLHSNLNEFLIMQILNDMSKNNKKTVEEFETIFERIQKENARTANQNIGSWQFYIPINVTLNPDIAPCPRIRILGKEFSFVSLTSVKRRIGAQYKALLENPKTISSNIGTDVNCIPEVFLSVSSQGPNWLPAWQKIESAFDALRGLFEITSGLYRGRIKWGKQSARRQIPHPLWMMAYKKNAPPEWRAFDTEDDNEAKKFDINSAYITLVKKNATILKMEAKTNSTLSLIADCLRLYSQAMDANSNYLCFLGFWQLAEAITHSEAVGGKVDKIIQRIAWHGMEFGLKGSGYNETLKVLGEKRNNIVHRGIHDIEDDDINILKAACEVALEWLFQVHKSLPTLAHIEYFYSLREKNDTDFEALKDCVGYINEQKTTEGQSNTSSSRSP